MLNIYAFEGKHDHKLTPIIDALREQNRLLKNKITKTSSDPDNHVFFTEHLPIYAYDPRKIKNVGKIVRHVTNCESVKLPFPLVAVSRAGSITYHGPGQLVYYLVLDLDTVRIRSAPIGQCIDEIMIEALKEFGITAHQKPTHLPEAGSGVWVTARDGTQKKIASRGIAIRNRNGKRITQFGFAINVNTDMRYFDYIYPCGLDIEMTSMKEMLGGTVLPLQEIAKGINAIISTQFKQTKRHPQQ